MADPAKPLSGQVLFEFTRVGNQMRVAAIHADSSVEVVVVAPLTASRTQMQDVALAKLRRRVGQLAAGSRRPS